ncbi:MAG: serine/threonine protein kinase, partial [Phycisphaerae bacterium]
MANAALQKALQIFEQVCDLPADKREQALNDACGADLALRSRVEAMLRQDTNETHPLHVNLFANNSSAQANDTQGSVDEHPAQIGGYRIVRKIGEGAMGTVYEGRQQSPKRAVAIKVLRPTGNWHSLQKRFEHEAFILGRLQHPGIAQIIEAGRQPAPGGEQLYLVMELVRGRELLKYAENKPLDSRQRLELFIRICEAVQHAHQKAVIHRDLKPANILVVDDESTLSRLTDTAVRVSGQPKILDFGVARLTDSDLHVTTVATGMGQMIGTLPYMSPEQIVGDPQEIDTRADVYSLGVVLHELLTGRLPYDLRNRSMFEAARIIREDPPQRLSAINRALRGDLDTIVGKALEKDKSRRYQSASELAADVRAFLDSAPIAARRDSRFYVLQKTLKRYKLATSMAAALLLLSIGSAIAFASLYRKADAAALAAQRESLHAQEAEAAARRQARRAFGISSFLQHVLQSADSRALGRDAKIVDSLEYARNRIDEVLADDLESKTGAYYALSQTYGDLGQYPTAEALIRQALQLLKTLTPDGSSELGDLVNHHGAMLFALGRFDEAVVLFNEALRCTRSSRL